MTQTSLEDYRVQLDAYSGPLDLLLFLVKRDEIDLNDIPIARLTDQYLAHLRLIEQIDVNLAGEFLVMAATLVEIKSQMLVPRDEREALEDAEDDTAQNALDPRYELVQQLLAYKRFKDAADELEDRRSDWVSRFAAKPSKAPKKSAADSDVEGEDAEEVEIDLEDANVLDLCEAFARILDSIGTAPATHDVTYDDTPIELHADDIVDRLERDGAMSLQEMFVGRQNRSEMIGLFLATLELVRQKRVRVLQNAETGEINLDLRPAEDMLGGDQDAETDWRDPKTGEMQYEWPSEEARLRAEKRADRRARWYERQKEGDDTEDVVDLDEDDLIDRDDDAERSADDDEVAVD